MDNRELNAFIAEHVYGEPEPTGPVPEGVMHSLAEIEVGSWIATTSGYDDGDRPIWVPANFCGNAELATRAMARSCAQNGWSYVIIAESTGVVRVLMFDTENHETESMFGMDLSYTMMCTVRNMLLSKKNKSNIKPEYDFSGAQKNPYVKKKPSRKQVVMDIALIVSGMIALFFIMSRIARM